MAQQLATVWRRPPSETELAQLMQDWTVEETLVREAQALGLDRDDAMIRNRLHQKMAFLLEAPASGMTPDDAALESFYQADPARFALPVRVSIQQVMLPEGARAEQVRTIRAAFPTVAMPWFRPWSSMAAPRAHQYRCSGPL